MHTEATRIPDKRQNLYLLVKFFFSTLATSLALEGECWRQNLWEVSTPLGYTHMKSTKQVKIQTYKDHCSVSWLAFFASLRPIRAALGWLRLRHFALATGTSIVTSAKFEVYRSLIKLRLVTTNACSGFPEGSVVYLLLSINKSFEFLYFGMKDSRFCRPFPLHIINLNADECLLMGHVVSSYINQQLVT